MWDFFQSVLKDVVTTQSVKIAVYAIVIATAILTVFLLAWGVPFSEILRPDGSTASSGIRHLSAIAYLPFVILIWFILYLQIHSERDDLYSGIRKKLEGQYMVTYEASNGPDQEPILDAPLQVPCEIRINPENKKLELVFRVKNNPIYTDGDDTVTAVALRYDSGTNYELMYYIDTNRYLKEIVTKYLIEDQYFAMDKGLEVRAFGLLKFEAKLDSSKVKSLMGKWFDLNGRITQIFALLDEAKEAQARQEAIPRRSLSEVKITLDNFHAMMGNIVFERIA
jgi:hypothetical protein